MCPECVNLGSLGKQMMKAQEMEMLIKHSLSHSIAHRYSPWKLIVETVGPDYAISLAING